MEGGREKTCNGTVETKRDANSANWRELLDEGGTVLAMRKRRVPSLDSFSQVAMLCRTMKITEILIAEHTVFHSLFDHIEANVPGARTLAVVKSLTVTVQTLTRPHSETEDELFIKPLEHYFDQIGHQATFHEEHELIEKALAGVLKTKDLKVAKKLLLGAVVASRKHFDKEERIVFPMAERVLKASTLTELGKQWRKKRDEKITPE